MIISLFYGFFLFIGMKDNVMIFTITHVFCSIIWVMLKYSCKETDYIFASQYWRLKFKRNELWEKILKKFYRWNTNKVDKRNIKKCMFICIIDGFHGYEKKEPMKYEWCIQR